MKWHSKASADVCRLAGINDPLEAVNALVDELLALSGQVGPRVSLELVASFQGIRRVDYVDMDGAGRLIGTDDGYAVQINKRQASARQCFTLAHEICHPFFREAEGLRRDVLDEATALFDIENEEEYLCDTGASRVLLHPNWLLPMAKDQSPSIQRLIDIAEACGSSIEATAFQLIQARGWQCSIVFWEPGMRKAERISPQQMSFSSVIEQHGSPKEKLRVVRCYAAPGTPFLPINKSVSFDSSIYAALSSSRRTNGTEMFDLGRVAVNAGCESEYMPYRNDRGELRARVVTLMVWG